MLAMGKIFYKLSVPTLNGLAGFGSVRVFDVCHPTRRVEQFYRNTRK